MTVVLRRLNRQWLLLLFLLLLPLQVLGPAQLAALLQSSEGIREAEPALKREAGGLLLLLLPY
jgi:hypothetical protein